MAKLEGQFLSASGSAFAAARRQVLASGQSVFFTEGDALYELFPDGTRKLVKQIEASTAVVPGSTYTIK